VVRHGWPAWGPPLPAAPSVPRVRRASRSRLSVTRRYSSQGRHGSSCPSRIVMPSPRERRRVRGRLERPGLDLSFLVLICCATYGVTDLRDGVDEGLAAELRPFNAKLVPDFAFGAEGPGPGAGAGMGLPPGVGVLVMPSAAASAVGV